MLFQKTNYYKADDQTYSDRFWICAFQPCADAQSLSHALRLWCEAKLLVQRLNLCATQSTHFTKNVGSNVRISQNDVVGKMALPALYCRLYTLPRSCATHSYSFFFFIHFNFFSHGLVSFSIPCTAIRFEIESNDKCRQFNSNHDDGGTSRTP